MTVQISNEFVLIAYSKGIFMPVVNLLRSESADEFVNL